jgi:hypothetical protein
MRKQQTTQNRRTCKSKTSACSEQGKNTPTNCSTEKWLNTNQSRKKTVVLTLQRTNEGYAIENATILRKVNQHRTIPVSADIRAITNDLTRKGFKI